MTKINIKKIQDIEINYHEITNNECVFSIKSSHTLIDSTGKNKQIDSQILQHGITETKQIKNWDGNSTLTNPNHIYLAKPRLLVCHSKYGWPGYHLDKQGYGYNDFEPLLFKDEKDLYACFQSLTQDDYSVVQIDGMNQSFLLYQDHAFKRVTKPFYFSYISDEINDAVYDLDKVAEALIKNPNVIILTKQDKPLEYPIPEVEYKNIIHDIPSYNQDGCAGTLTISFSWTPPQEIFDKIPSNHSGNSYEAHKYIRENDLLGIEKFRIKKEQDLEPIKRSKFKA